jgi:acyl carrier protein
MELKEFIIDLAGEFEDTDTDITEDMEFRKLEAWDSLTGMAVLYMIECKYDVIIPVDDFIKLVTPKEVFGYIQKQQGK